MLTWRNNGDFVTAETYAEFYNCTKNLVYVAYKNKNPYVIKYNNKSYVNLKALKRRREFHNSVYEEVTNGYWELIDTVGMNALTKQLSKELGKTPQHWRSFLHKDLFSTAFRERNLLSYKIPKMLWTYYRWYKTYTRRNR